MSKILKFGRTFVRKTPFPRTNREEIRASERVDKENTTQDKKGKRPHKIVRVVNARRISTETNRTAVPPQARSALFWVFQVCGAYKLWEGVGVWGFGCCWQGKELWDWA